MVATMNPSRTKRNNHILHVDDPDIRLLISASLRDFGYFVVTAGSVAEALQLARDLKFNPSSSMCACPTGQASNYASNYANYSRGSLVLYYSAYADDAEQKAALSVCGDAYLKKPVSAEYLEQTISQLLHQKPDNLSRGTCFDMSAGQIPSPPLNAQAARFEVLRWRVSASRRDRCRWKRRASNLW